ncbi:MAG: hypothetical protein HY922_05510, partial [Elusimicrobia bacterium]|nr:hypothetical protein [Elusimicrobiota bacterium]
MARSSILPLIAAGQTLKTKVVEARGIALTLDQETLAAKSRLPAVKGVFEPIHSGLASKPAKPDQYGGGMSSRLEYIEKNLTKSLQALARLPSSCDGAGARWQAAVAGQQLLSKTVVQAKQAKAQAVWTAKESDKLIQAALRKLKDADDKTSAAALDAYDKKLQSGLDAVAKALGKGLAGKSLSKKLMPKLGAKCGSVLALALPEAKDAGKLLAGKGGVRAVDASLSKSESAKAGATSEKLQTGKGLGSGPWDKASGKPFASLAAAPGQLKASAPQASDLNCSEDDPRVGKECYPLYQANCGRDPMCSPTAHILYSECRTRCGENSGKDSKCTNTSERMALFTKCESAWRAQWNKCEAARDPVVCHAVNDAANEEATRKCNAEAGTHCVRKEGPTPPKPPVCKDGQVVVGKECKSCLRNEIVVGGKCQACPKGQEKVGNACKAPTKCTGDKVSDGKGGCVSCPKGQVVKDGKCAPCGKGQIVVGNACKPSCDGKAFDSTKTCCFADTTLLLNPDKSCPKMRLSEEQVRQIREKVAQEALSRRDSTEWRRGRVRPPFESDADKCNQF